MYADAYKLHETFFDMGNDVDDWAECARICNEVCQHHGNHPLMMDMAIAVYRQLERDRREPEDGT